MTFFRQVPFQSAILVENHFARLTCANLWVSDSDKDSPTEANYRPALEALISCMIDRLTFMLSRHFLETPWPPLSPNEHDKLLAYAGYVLNTEVRRSLAHFSQQSPKGIGVLTQHFCNRGTRSRLVPYLESLAAEFNLSMADLVAEDDIGRKDVLIGNLTLRQLRWLVKEYSKDWGRYWIHKAEVWVAADDSKNFLSRVYQHIVLIETEGLLHGTQTDWFNFDILLQMKPVAATQPRLILDSSMSQCAEMMFLMWWRTKEDQEKYAYSRSWNLPRATVNQVVRNYKVMKIKMEEILLYHESMGKARLKK